MPESNEAQPLQTLRQVAARLRETMQCNCDLDKWQPQRSTGHSMVCRIHRAAVAEHERVKFERFSARFAAEG